ncbi:hypothetical protein FACS1894188_05980 [Clostridia bacterium]|nr:hypothetical protein FACS1894188_05980 [Clostridia bacterium]
MITTESVTRRKKISDILDERTFVWKKTGETDPPKKYKSLQQLSQTLAERDEQVLTYFLDGSWHVYKVEDRAYPSGGRTLIYPTIARQVGVGICK